MSYKKCRMFLIPGGTITVDIIIMHQLAAPGLVSHESALDESN